MAGRQTMNKQHWGYTASRQMAPHSGLGKEVIYHPCSTCSICLPSSRIGVWAPIEVQADATWRCTISHVTERDTSITFNDAISCQDYIASVVHKWNMSTEHRQNEMDKGNRSTPRKICPSATLSTANPIRTALGSKPWLRGERRATDLLR
jgi:hypothetical protein